MPAAMTSIIAGAMIVVAILIIVPLLNKATITDHYKGLILLAVIFAVIGAIFGIHHGSGAVAGLVDGLLIFAVVCVVGWIFGRLRRLAR